ncbi:MAG: response regulator [Candidatus Kapabacteria bacterium]|nr:response regulator [Candidatus Kapabacteria bacterium]MBX7155279.1 response regulator [Bacteroidota bacterium]
MRFLVVDDSPTMRRIVVNALQTFGWDQIVEAQDGQEALSKLKEHPVEFVITDWNMPVMTGLELTKAIRSDGTLAKLPVLMVTTRGLKQDIIEALQAKVNNYVVKPFTPQILKEKIDTVLQTMAA